MHNETHDIKIKEYCSCVRNTARWEALGKHMLWVDRNPSPREGDLVMVRVLEDGGAYDHIENRQGRHVRLYAGDLVICVLGTRRSGTNLSGSFPKIELEKGMGIELLSVGGIVGICDCTPGYFGSKPLRLAIEAFPQYEDEIVNTRSLNPEKVYYPEIVSQPENIIWIGGTSAESGKTTLLCQAIRCLRSLYPHCHIAALKVVGSGRLRDPFDYKDAGADFFSDFVDEGWPSTYNMTAYEFNVMLQSLLNKSSMHCNITICEIGGDLLGGCAPWALELCASSRFPFFLAVNDAMGAMAGLEILAEKGISRITVCTFKQNAISLAGRLGLANVMDMRDKNSVMAEFKNVLYGEIKGESY